MFLTSRELEIMADYLLDETLTDMKRNKITTSEYPILSKSQQHRREMMEIPFSNLTENQKQDCHSKNLDYAEKEGD